MEGKKLKVVITGGGTGGHIFPGIAVARELAGRPEVDVVYVGKHGGLESKWVPDSGFEFEGLRAVPFPRGLTHRWLTFGWDLARGLAEAFALAGKHRPAAVFSTGGYVSVPFSLAAVLRGIPVVLFEPNVVPGLAARSLALFSRRIFTGFEGTLKKMPKRRSRWTGIPIRQEIRDAERAKARESFGLSPDIPTVLMLGGSQGARALNHAMAGVIRFVGEGERPAQFILMTGWNDYRSTVDHLEKCPLKVVIRPFLSNIHEAYAAADLLVARSGAMTCAEAASRGLPALFIPYPHASGHQELNARALEAAGAAKVIPEGELDEEALSTALLSLLADEGRLKAMGEAAREVFPGNAAGAIADELIQMAKGS